jgi:hypothetical protein
MATKGRGGDSMLVHMTPREVASLQALAVKNGTSLTVNPDTGLPEAFKLKDLLPMIAGAALGPAGFGLMSATMAGVTVGGITTLATGSLSRGLMAGLGAYGGAGLAESLAGAGTGAMAAGDIAAQQAAGTFPVAPELAGMTAEQAAAATNSYASQVSGVRDMALSKAGEAGFGAKAAAGFGQMASNPGLYGKEALMGLAAISPMLADKGVQTTTKMPSTGTIRRYTFDPYGQSYTPAGEYAAAEEDRKATGGIVALAAGGPSYIDLNANSSADQIASAYKAFTDASGGDTKENQAAAIDYLTNLGIGQDKINQSYSNFQEGPKYTNYTAQDVTDYLQANPTADIAAATQQFNADPTTVNQAIGQLGAGFLDPTETAKGSGSGQYFDTFSKYGIDANELFAANKALNPNYSFAGDTTAGEMNRAFEMARDFKGFNPVGTSQALQDVEWVKKMDTEGANAVDIARLTGLSIGEVQSREAAARTLMTKGIGTGKLDTVDILPGGGPGGISGGGNTVVNPNGTVTTTPDIPGRPDGGFTGIGQVKDVYTQGGGSLGYVNNAPKDMDEFNRRFNTQTGDSLAAYNYLIGKGAYPTQSGVGQIMRPYGEGVLGMPVTEGRPTQRYIYDPVTRGYKENPNYVPITYDSKGKRVEGLSTNEVLKGVKELKDPADNVALFDWANANNVTAAQLAAALGISISEARARIAAGKAKSTTATAATSSAPVEGGGGGDDGGGPPGDTGGSPGASGSADGSAGGCVDPAVMVLLADGGHVRAGDLSVGDMLHTLHEDTFVYGNFPVEFVEIIQQPKVEAGFDDNQKIIVSTTHKFLTADGVWKQMRDLVIGDVVRATGDATKKLTSVKTLGEGPVVKMTVTDAHTYIADGLVSHNKARGGMVRRMALGGLGALAGGGQAGYNLGGYSDGGRLLRGPGDGVSDSIPATIGNKQPARLADGEFVVPARIVSELGNGSTEAGARKLYAMMDRVQKARGKTTGKSRVAANTRSDKYLPA